MRGPGSRGRRRGGAIGHRRLRWGLAVGVLALVAASCDYVHPPLLAVVDQPVVLTGAELPGSAGLDPTRAVAYRHDPDDGWVQIPLQVDERFVIDLGTRPSSNAAPGIDGTVYGSGNTSGVTAVVYADPGTFVGPDPDPTFDADDELVVMARDAGPRAPDEVPSPPGTSTAGLEVEVEPLTTGGPGHIYLFRGPVGVDQSAGEDHVDYDFVLDSGEYRSTYRRADGPNPESSVFTSDAYTLGFDDRWQTTELRLRGGPDILDGFKNRFSFATCGRSNATFADAEGAFVANIDGPLRAIRSYVGANSGPFTQQTLRLYEHRIEVDTDLRVHPIGGVMAFVDLGVEAAGMEYGSSELAEPVTVDGTPDSVPTAVPAFEYLEGPDGAVSWVSGVETSYDLGDPLEQVYEDDADTPVEQCWGDDAFYGAAGVAVTSPIPNTDPARGPAETFRAHQVIGVWPAGTDAAAWAEVWAPGATSLETTVRIR